jgi:pimeloyl-ACP methyl ester carboxylesterase
LIAHRDEGRGEPLILIHGITEDHRVWQEFMPELTRSARVIRVDLPGHGDSAVPPEFNAAALTTPVAELCQKLALDRPRVIGHSLGGVVATLLAALVPVRSVVNVDQSLRLGPFIEHLREIAPKLDSPRFCEELNAEMERLGGPNLPEQVRRELRAYRTEASRPAVLGLWLPLMSQTEQAVLEPLAPLLRQIRAPYLSLFGDDPGPGYESWLRQFIPQAQVETWPGLGHWLHRVDPARFLARVREFHAAA